MNYNVIEIDDVVIGKANDVLKFLAKIRSEIWTDNSLDREEKIEKRKELTNIIYKITNDYFGGDLVYLKRDWSGKINVRYLDTDLL